MTRYLLRINEQDSPALAIYKNTDQVNPRLVIVIYLRVDSRTPILEDIDFRLEGMTKGVAICSVGYQYERSMGSISGLKRKTDLIPALNLRFNDLFLVTMEESHQYVQMYTDHVISSSI
jgi:hypothetical protein